MTENEFQNDQQQKKLTSKSTQRNDQVCSFHLQHFIKKSFLKISVNSVIKINRSKIRQFNFVLKSKSILSIFLLKFKLKESRGSKISRFTYLEQKSLLTNGKKRTELNNQPVNISRDYHSCFFSSSYDLANGHIYVKTYTFHSYFLSRFFLLVWKPLHNSNVK